tara:strand:+ start:100 stop:384 length:285 start_codon:yes stop_codon:yes gene_type:complete
MITEKEKSYLQVAWENDRPIPARTNGTLKSSWNFVPNEERKRTIDMYPIMRTGAMGLALKEFVHKKAKKEQAKVFLNKLLQAKRSQVVTKGGSK